MIAKEMISEIPVGIESDEKLSHLIGSMKKRGISEAYIIDEGDFAGVFSHTKLFKSKLSPSETDAGTYSKSVSWIDKEQELKDVVIEMIESDSNLLPVFDKDNDFLGVIDIFSVLDKIKDIPEIKDSRLMDLKKEKKISVNENEKISTVLEIMKEHKIAEIPVKSEGEYIGLISHTDLLSNYLLMYGTGSERKATIDSKTRSFRPEPPKLSDLPVTDFMENRNLLHYPISEKLGKVARDMAKQRSVIAVEEDTGKLIKAENILLKYINATKQLISNIQFVGINDLYIEDREKERIKKLAPEYAEKMQREFNNVFDLTLHVEQHQKEGKQHRYEAHARLKYPGVEIIASREEHWNPVTVVREALEDIISQVKSRYKKSNAKEYPSANEFFDEPA